MADKLTDQVNYILENTWFAASAWSILHQKFALSSSWQNCISSMALRTDWLKDKMNNRAASIIKKKWETFSSMAPKRRNIRWIRISSYLKNSYTEKSCMASYSILFPQICHKIILAWVIIIGFSLKIYYFNIRGK